MPSTSKYQSPANNSSVLLASSSGNELLPFNFNDKEIHVELRHGDPIFLAKDVCDVLGLVNARKAVGDLEKYQYLTSLVVTSGQGRNMNFVNESGLYSLIFQSRKPEAKAFQKWVTGTVLPSVRKYGMYCMAFMQLELNLIDGREMYLYEDVRHALGFKNAGSATGRRTTWPNEFVSKYGRVFVTIPYANLMAAQRGLTKMRATLKANGQKEVCHV